MTKFAVTHRPGDTISFWRDCCRLDIPFVTIEEKQKYSLVSWDNISRSSAGQHMLNLNRASIAIRLQRLYREYSRDSLGSQFIDPFVGYVRTEKERARELAGEIYDCLTMQGTLDRIERPLPLGIRSAW
jgi:hypothetical protein